MSFMRLVAKKNLGANQHGPLTGKKYSNPAVWH
jgi:hypothetical protein